MRRRIVDTAALAILAALALAGFRTVYIGQTYLLAGLAGLALGVVAALLGRRYALPVAASTAGAVIAGLLLAGPVVLRETVRWGVLPTAATGRGIVAGVGSGWRDLLTTLPPVPDHGPLLLVPYVCGLAVGLAGTLLAGLRAPAAPLLAPAALLATTILFGTAEPAQVLLQGAGFAAVAVAWVAARQGGVVASQRTRMARWTRPLGALAVLAVAATAAYAAPVDPVRPRFVLREHVTPPFDPSQYPSPLAAFRRYEIALKDRTLFTVHGLPPGTRLRLAVMDLYDGVVWSVAGGATATTGSGVFERIGARVPGTRAGPSADLDITVRDLDGVWLPGAGALHEVAFTGQRSTDLAATLRYNRSTGVAVVPAGLRSGDAYHLRARLVPPTSAPAVAGRPAAAMILPDPVNVPDEVAVAAVEWAAGATGPVAQMQALVNKLRAGAFSDGTNTAGVSVRPGHGAGRLREFLTADQLVGDAEQYAATLGLLARALGLPVRVVLGVQPPGGFTGDVTGAMVTAWVELAVDGAGWVPFDPTPPRTNKPDPPQPRQEPDGTSEVIQPPVVVAAPPEQLPAPDTGNNPPPPPPEPPPPIWLVVLLAVLRYAGPPALAIGAYAGLVAGLKWLRRRRRQRRGSPSDRMAGGWADAMDRLRDLGIAAPVRGGTRLARAAGLAAVDRAVPYAGVTAVTLAEAADEAVFGPGGPERPDIVRYWAQVDRYVHAVAASRPRLRRLTAAMNPSSLRPARSAVTHIQQRQGVRR